MDDQASITRRTFRLDLLRSIPLGIVETLFQTFAVLVLIKYFESGQMTKASLIALSKLGLIASFAIVPLLRLLGWKTTTLSGTLNLVSTAGMATAAIARSEQTFIASLMLAAIAFMLQIPLLTHIYRANYPDGRRGQLFGFSATLRGVAAALFALWAGRYLEADIARYQPLMWLFVACGLASSATLFATPSPPAPAGGVQLFDAFGWLGRDRVFRHLIISWFLMGSANLTCVALHVEWLASPKTGLGLDEFTVSFIGVTIFVTAKLSATFLWARWFDRVSFFLLRIILNCVFATATLLIFTTQNVYVVGLGFAMQGFAFAGGNIAWSLWVTKIAPEEHVAEYMSVHTFLTGIRGVCAPFLGFWLITVTSPASIAVGAASVMLLACLLILPEVRRRPKKKPGRQASSRGVPPPANPDRGKLVTPRHKPDTPHDMIPHHTRLLPLLLALLLGLRAHAQEEKPSPDEPAPEAPKEAPAEESPTEEEQEEPKEDPAKENEDGAEDSEKVEEEVEAQPEPGPQDDGYQQVEILLHAIETIRQKYTDEDKVSYERLMEAALEGMFSSLDPHSSYMHRRLFEQMQKSQGNSYDGIGITISFRDNLLRIVSVREDGPAARAGIFPGDEIIRIDNVLTDQVGIAEALEMLRGNPGQPIKLVVRRASTKEMHEMEIVREVVKESTIKDVMLLKPKLAGEHKIGYLRLLQFNRPTARELADSLDELEDRGMEALVLDLRNNPGGLLSSAVDVCGEFLPPNTTVLTTRGRVDSQNSPPYRTSEKQRRARNYPVAILINQSSASGAEVVAGALQDLKRAVIVGETSFGKGSVQSIIPMGMGTGAAMRLTTAKYYTPSQKVIHENGVTPNIEITLTPSEDQDLARWRNRSNLSKEDQQELEHFRDRQLERAVDAMKGALVYQKKTPAKKENEDTKPKPRRPFGA